MSNAAVNWVSEARLRLVADSDDSVEAFLLRNVVEELRHIAGSENLMHGGEMGGALLGVEVRRKYASGHTLPPQELACATWAAATTSTPTTGAASSATARHAAASHVCTTHYYFYFHSIATILAHSLLKGEMNRELYT